MGVVIRTDLRMCIACVWLALVSAAPCKGAEFEGGGKHLPSKPVAQAVGPVIAEVVVTARKRSEAAGEVPISVSVRTGEQLDQAVAHRLQDIAQTVPNLAVEVLNPRQTSFAIRGIGRNPANDGLESSVGVFLDGVYLGRPGMAVADLFDLERIEVLRGPQGALFGKNTTAGVVHIITRAPTDAFEGYAEATMGNASFVQLHGVVSGPLASGWSGRLAGLATRREGFVSGVERSEDLGEFHRNSVRAQLAWRDRSFDLRLIGDYSDQDEDGPGLVLVDPGIRMEDGSTRPNNFLDRVHRAGAAVDFDPFARRNSGDAEQRVRSEQGGLAAHARWTLGGHTLSSITAWRMWNSRPRTDSDFTLLDIQRQLHFEVSAEQVTTELRLASPTNEEFDYQAGVFLFGQNLESDFVASYGEHAADFAQPGLPARALDGFQVQTLSHPRTRSSAAFGHVDWKVAPHLTLSGGLRWTTEDKEAAIRRTSSGGSALTPNDGAIQALRDRLGAPTSVVQEFGDNFTSGSLALSYRTAPEALAYIAASRGAKAGGVNVAIVPVGIDQVLDPEVATSYEIGYKQAWRDAAVTVAFFDMRIDDYHATVRDSFRAATFLANAGEVRTRGIEFEGVYRPLDNLQLSLAGGWADAEFTSFRQAACPPETVGRTVCDLTGAAVPGAPPWTTALSAAYELPVSSSYRAFFGGEWIHSSSYQVELSSYTTIDAYDLLNVRIGLRSSANRWEFWLWTRNLLNEAYYSVLGAGGPFNSGAVYGLVADPRTYGASVRINY